MDRTEKLREALAKFDFNEGSCAGCEYKNKDYDFCFPTPDIEHCPLVVEELLRILKAHGMVFEGQTILQGEQNIPVTEFEELDLEEKE